MNTVALLSIRLWDTEVSSVSSRGVWCNMQSADVLPVADTQAVRLNALLCIVVWNVAHVLPAVALFTLRRAWLSAAAQPSCLAHLFHINWLAPGAEPRCCFWTEEITNKIIHLPNPVERKPLTLTSNTSVCSFHHFMYIIYWHKLSLVYLSASASRHVANLNIWPGIIPGLYGW